MQPARVGVLLLLAISGSLFVGPLVYLDCPFRADVGVVSVDPASEWNAVDRSDAIPVEDLSVEGRRAVRLARSADDGRVTLCGERNRPEEFRFSDAVDINVVEDGSEYYVVESSDSGFELDPLILAGTWIPGLLTAVAGRYLYGRTES